MKIFIAGDKYFQPEIMIPRLKEALKDAKEDIIFDSVKLPYPVDHLSLSDDYHVPTGMAWDQNMDEDYGTQGVREYYGRNDTLKGMIGDADILIVHGAALPASIIDEAKNLKLICCMRGGPVNLDLDYAKSKGIRCSNSPGKNAEAVAEYTLGLILSHIRHIPLGNAGLARDEYIQRYNDYDVLAYELTGLKFGLVGFGRIAQKLSRILKAFDAEILAYDPFMPAETVHELGATPCDMDTLLKEADIVSLHARGKGVIMGEREFGLMKSSALFVNTARGTGLVYNSTCNSLLPYDDSMFPMPEAEPMFLPPQRAQLPTVRGELLNIPVVYSAQQLTRAIRDGLFYECRRGVERLLNGAPIGDTVFRCVGGHVKYHYEMQLKADALGCPIEIGENEDIASKGAFILAGYGCGWFDSVAETAKEMYARVKTTVFEPDPERSARYNEIYHEHYLPLFPDGIHSL